MIRINDRQDPQQGSQELSGAQLVDSTDPTKRSFTAPQKAEFTARLMSTVATDRFLVAIGDPEAPEGEAPDVWYGVVETWQPQGSQVLVTARAARSVEEAVHW
ncbi:hypothetical protein [Nocardia sp. NPDC019255]|uniref:hypothetical protein n=1 Tax=Nocardia sp. NPDC019255 TaxID=3154591 RepID=UPI0033CDC0ED